MLNLKIHPLVAIIVIGLAGLAAVIIAWPTTARTGQIVSLYQEQSMQSTWNTATAVTPRIDASQPAEFETATFAVG